MKTRIVRYFIVAAICFFVGTQLGCMSAAQHQQSLHSANERNMTVGVVQREIRKGMAQSDVAEALGSPNLVSKDGDGREVWIYDKIATEASYSNDAGSLGALGGAGGMPGSVLFLGLGSGSYSKNAGAAASTQKTLTVVIKFGKDSRVENFSYHASTF